MYYSSYRLIFLMVAIGVSSATTLLAAPEAKSQTPGSGNADSAVELDDAATTDGSTKGEDLQRRLLEESRQIERANKQLLKLSYAASAKKVQRRSSKCLRRLIPTMLAAGAVIGGGVALFRSNSRHVFLGIGLGVSVGAVGAAAGSAFCPREKRQ